MGIGEKKNEIYKNEYENKGKNSPFGCPPIPPSTKLRPTVFRYPKTSRNYPRWDRGPSLVGQKIQGWVLYG